MTMMHRSSQNDWRSMYSMSRATRRWTSSAVCKRPARAVDRGPAGHARLDAVAVGVLGDELRRLDVTGLHPDRVRARADQRHLAGAAR